MKLKNYPVKSMMAMAAITLSASAFSQARVQIIHNSADAATAVVDVWAGNTLLLDDFEFRTASPFVDVTAGTVNIGIAASTSTASSQSLATFPLTVADGETYVAIANGILSGSGYSPAPAVSVDVYELGQEAANVSTNTDVLVFHGSTDAPTVDVSTPGGASTPLVDDAAYGDFAGYLELPTDDYVLNVTDNTGSTVVASFEAPLETLNLNGAAAVVVASGFLDPSNNSNGEDFGLWVALPAGGDLVELPASEARLQVIHNSADAAAENVDVYFNGDLLIDDFAFRSASAFIDVPAEVENEIAIAPSTSSSVTDAIVTIPVTFATNETYVAIANGIISASGYTPAPGFSLDVYDMGQEDAATTGNTDVLVFHGSTDAPTVDVDEATAGNLVDDAAYGDFAGYLALATNDYILQVKDMAGSSVLFSYSAPLATLSLDNAAIVVVASGFVDPAANSDGAAFGLWVALPTGGEMVELPVAFAGIEENNFDGKIYPNPVDQEMMISGIENGTNINILDVTGKIVSNYTINNNAVLDVSDLNEGIYFIQFVEAQMTQKFIKR